MATEGRVDEVVEKIETVVANQTDQVEDSIWADPPELSETQNKQLSAAARESSAAAQFDDTNHADDESAAGDPATQKSPATETVDEVVPTGEEVVQPEAKGEDQEPEFDPSLLAAAGLASAEEAKVQFGTPKALENAVRLIDMRSVGVAEAALAQHLAAQTRQTPPTPQQQIQTITPASAPEFKMPDPPEGEEWDNATIALFKGLHDQFAQRLDAQKAEIEAAKAFQAQLAIEREQHELRRYVDEFDSFVNKLGDDWKPLLGEGSGFQLKKDSLQLRNRVQLDSISKQLAFGRSAQGLPELSKEDLLTRALRVAFPQKQEQQVRQKVEEEVANRSRMLTNRPTSKATKGKTGEQAAASYAEEWYNKRGMQALPNDDFEYDTI